jgi:hypothetical protein
MKTRLLLAVALSASVICTAGSVVAGERSYEPPKPNPFQKPRPPKPPVEIVPRDTVKADTEPFDLSKLDPVDARATKAIEKVSVACRASEFSREGPLPTEAAKCKTAVNALAAQGPKAASAIIAVLNLQEYKGMRRFGYERLWNTLAKIDDEKVRNVVIDGYVKISDEKLSSHRWQAYLAEKAMFTLSGDGPPAEIPWTKSKVVRDFDTQLADSAAGWRAFKKASEGKTRKQLKQAALAAARKNKTSDDPKAAYRAAEVLRRFATLEALFAVRAYQKRKDLTSEVRGAFETLEERIGWDLDPRGDN